MIPFGVVIGNNLAHQLHGCRKDFATAVGSKALLVAGRSLLTDLMRKN
jgi:hypothetical protein